jgi:hypothetical protein
MKLGFSDSSQPECLCSGFLPSTWLCLLAQTSQVPAIASAEECGLQDSLSVEDLLLEFALTYILLAMALPCAMPTVQTFIQGAVSKLHFYYFG